MRSIVARRAYCVDISLVCSRFFKNVQIRHSIRLSFNYFNFQRFYRHQFLKNARSNLASGPFLDLFLSYLPLIESFCRSKPDHLMVRTSSHGRTDTHHFWRPSHTIGPSGKKAIILKNHIHCL